MTNEKPTVVSDKVKSIYIALDARWHSLDERSKRYQSDSLHDLGLSPETKKAIYKRMVRPCDANEYSNITSDLKKTLDTIRRYIGCLDETNGKHIDGFDDRNGKFTHYGEANQEWHPAKPYVDQEKRDKQNKGDPVWQKIELINEILSHWGWLQASGGRRSDGFRLRSFDKGVFNNTNKFVKEARARFSGREMGEDEYKSIASEEHPAIIGLKNCDALKPYYIENPSLVDLDGHSIISPAEWMDRKDATFLKRVPQDFVDETPTNPVEERPSILFGDSTEYKTEMKKLAERFGGRII